MKSDCIAFLQNSHFVPLQLISFSQDVHCVLPSPKHSSVIVFFLEIGNIRLLNTQGYQLNFVLKYKIFRILIICMLKALQWYVYDLDISLSSFHYSMVVYIYCRNYDFSCGSITLFWFEIESNRNLMALTLKNT